jgi:hypothetical protein
MSGTDYTTTPNLGLYKPVYDADDGQWGTHLNTNADTLDSAIHTLQTTGVTSFNARAGAVTLNSTDVTTVLPPSSTTPAMDGTAAIGTGTTWARADHVHPSDTSRAAVSAIPAASSTPPLMDSVAAVGTGTTWARADHVHPTDTSRAPLASPAFTGTPTVPTAANATATTQAASTAFVRSGTATNDSAAAGQVGEYVTASQLTNVALTTVTVRNVTTISLTAGDWDVAGNVDVIFSSAGSEGIAAISTTTGAFSNSNYDGSAQVTTTTQGLAALVLATGPTRISVAATTTVYLVARAAFTAGTCNAQGTIRARRVR